MGNIWNENERRWGELVGSNYGKKLPCEVDLRDDYCDEVSEVDPSDV